MQVIATLTRSERQAALVILLVLFAIGLALMGAGRNDLLGGHGVLVMVVALAAAFAVISGYFAPEPGEERLDQYYDEPSKIGLVLAMVWAAVGMFFGVWVGPIGVMLATPLAVVLIALVRKLYLEAYLGDYNGADTSCPRAAA